jgi:F-type H+-transporting ATPase subunit delta
MLLRPIARQLQKLYMVELGLVDVEIRVASPLDPQIQQQIHDRLRERLGAEPVMNVSIDPSILAGIVIRAGDRVFDGSLATRFNQLRKTLVERVVERIETQPERFAL